jgi:hypothetical protein
MSLSAAQLAAVRKAIAVQVKCRQCGQKMRPLHLARHQASHDPFRFVDAEGDCWEWTGGKNPGGYGVACYPYRQRKLAHRYIYELLVGSIPLGMQIDHLCRNTGCVNPDHLEVVSPREHAYRGMHRNMRVWRRNRATEAA